MRKIKFFIAVFAILISALSWSLESKSNTIVAMPAQDGVFFLSNGYQKTVIELKSGYFRYWTSSDVISNDAKKIKYPITGKFLVDGFSVYLLNEDIYKNHRMWTFKKINHTTTIWADFAVNLYDESKMLHSYGILRLTNKTADEVMENRFY